jgi:hypothetical protein
MDQSDADGETRVAQEAVGEGDSKVAPPAPTAIAEAFVRFQRLSMALS